MTTGTLARTNVPLSAWPTTSSCWLPPTAGTIRFAWNLALGAWRGCCLMGVSAASIGGPAKATVTVSKLTASWPGWPGDGSVAGVPVATPATVRTSPEFSTVFGCGAETLIVGWAVGAMGVLLDFMLMVRRSGHEETVQRCPVPSHARRRSRSHSRGLGIVFKAGYELQGQVR